MAKVLRYKTDDELITFAGDVLVRRMVGERQPVNGSEGAADLLKLKLAGLEHEVFAVIFLDSRNRVLAFEKMFRGTINATAVYPREIAKSALRHNAAAIILGHNHPSGSAEPSFDDEILTTKLKDALALIDVRVIDHIVIGGKNYVSFAARGILGLPEVSIQRSRRRRRRARPRSGGR